MLVILMELNVALYHNYLFDATFTHAAFRHKSLRLNCRHLQNKMKAQ